MSVCPSLSNCRLLAMPCIYMYIHPILLRPHSRNNVRRLASNQLVPQQAHTHTHTHTHKHTNYMRRHTAGGNWCTQLSFGLRWIHWEHLTLCKIPPRLITSSVFPHSSQEEATFSIHHVHPSVDQLHTPLIYQTRWLPEGLSRSYVIPLGYEN